MNRLYRFQYCFCFLLLLCFSPKIFGQKDTISPIITVNPGAPGCIELRCDNPPYIDPGAKASDNLEGDISSRITVSGNVDTRLQGSYTIIYTVMDSSGNSDTATRTVCVEETHDNRQVFAEYINRQYMFYTIPFYSPVGWDYKWLVDGVEQPFYNGQYMFTSLIKDTLPHRVCIHERYCDDTTRHWTCMDFNSTKLKLKKGIEGRLFVDRDNDCVQDSLDNGILPWNIDVYDSSANFIGSAWVFNKGDFFYECGPGKYDLRVNHWWNQFFQSSCSKSLDTMVKMDSSQSLVSGLEFPVACKDPDIAVYAGYNGGAFPGRKHDVWVTALELFRYSGITCNPGVQADLKLTYSGHVKFIKASLGTIQPYSVVGNTITYHLPDSFFSRYNFVALELMTDSTAKSGDSVTLDAEVFPAQADSDTSNNRSHFVYKIMNSWDPNFKEVYPEVIELGYKGWLTYTVHFQNTGKAAAHNIKVLDTLDPLLDFSTFQILQQSHTMDVTLNKGIVKFYFPDIMLQDSNTDERASHGFVQYRVKVKGNSDTSLKIKNTAYIYFDYNEPVVTNTTVNTYATMHSGIKSVARGSISVYPNPGSGVYTVTVPNNMSLDCTAEVYNMLGELVYSISLSGANTQLNISGQPNGLYVLKVNNGDQILSSMMVKQ